jgi:N-acetylglutamate synthase/N-acetylornithine aminotransferase
VVSSGVGLLKRETWHPLRSRRLSRREIEIAVEVGGGSGAATVWTCELTEGYISINASYRS